MNWYVYSSGLDTDNPPKLTTEQVVALIIDKTIGKNAQVMRADDSTKSWIKITDTEFKKTFASLKQLESQQKSTEKAQRQAEKSAAQTQRQAEEAVAKLQQQEQESAEKAQRQADRSAKNTRHSTTGSTTKHFFNNFRNSFYGASSPYAIGNERYPNLTLYLAIMDTLIRVFFAIVQIVLILAVVFCIFTGLYFIVSNPFGWTEKLEVNKQQWNVETERFEDALDKNGDPIMITESGRYHPSTFFEGLGAIISGIVGGIISYFVLFWWRLLSLASLEMIHVFIDNESNTRKALER
jgi:hypothetical protein